MKRIAVLVYDQVGLFETSCALEVFGLERKGVSCSYACTTVRFSPEPVTTNVGVVISSEYVLSLNAFDMLIIPTWHTDGRAIDDVVEQSIHAFCRQRKPVISLCSGAFLLASLGLLENRQAITHWMYAAQFKALFPHIEYVDEALYVYDGLIGCSAGSASAIDLSLEIVRQDHGYEVANAIAKRMVVSAHRKGTQTQYAETPIPQQENSAFSPALDWALQNLDKAISIDVLAKKANMSRRSFDRKFNANFKCSPKIWLTSQRLSHAKRLLETTGFDIEKIAELSGFNNATSMRHHFRKSLGISPVYHRQQFRQLNEKPHQTLV